MKNMLDTRIYAALFFSLFFPIGEISGTTFPQAEDVKWHSFDFKTLLTWGPKPTNYSYTVEFSVVSKNRQRNPHCIRTMNTECDLTNLLTELKETYSAVVQSEALPGETSDQIEPPFTRSERFCPYKDTKIGKPDFKIVVSKDKRNITLYIQDPISAINKDGRFFNMRDIFTNDLKYRVSYGRAQSTGKRTEDTEGNTIQLDVDQGKSYCFNVRAYIPTRAHGNQFGDLSQTKCSPAGDVPFYKEYGIGAVVGIILLVLFLIAAAVALVVCYRRRSRTRNQGKDDCL
ncbi:hypothetical protein COCON_G00062270 [Conger conger]|uniref:Tissue factor n=1 Tax=Conger conger TaxID=82655 RepID=A0A9Q1DRS2_CONCO|nr:coagulation factor IIIa [Conger conger]KAJ8279161.1 hypothetical protein COCON_G00062270 [Conger conger]